MIFTLKNLEKHYLVGTQKIVALKNVSLSFSSSEFVVLLGPSGSGKSTLLNLMGGLDKPTEGEVFFGGLNLAETSLKKLTAFRRQHVGFVFQFYNLIPSLTAKENIELVTEIADDPLDAMHALEIVGLAERADHFPSQLSGGEQQRVAIARAIAKKPAILLCDEPTGALDFATGKIVLKALLDIYKNLGTLVMVITHNASIAELGSRIIKLANGSVIEDVTNTDNKTLEQISW